MLIILLILFQLIIFVALILVFRRIFTKNVVLATKHIDELSQDYKKKEEEIARQLEEAKLKSEELLVKARCEAEDLKARIIKEAEGERDKILEEAHIRGEEIIQQADRSRQLLISELDERIAKGAVSEACELIQYALPEEVKYDTHLRWMEELIGRGFSQLDRLRLPKGIQEVKIASAFPLGKGERESLLKKLEELLGYKVTLKEEVDLKIVAGFVVTVGSLVLDGSLKSRIQEQAKNVQSTSNE